MNTDKIMELLGASRAFPVSQLAERKRIARELRRIEAMKERGLNTWDDLLRKQQLRRRLVDLDLEAEALRR